MNFKKKNSLLLAMLLGVTLSLIYSSCDKDPVEFTAGDLVDTPLEFRSNDRELTAEATAMMQQYPNLQLVYNQFAGALSSELGAAFNRRYGSPNWEQSIITSSPYLMVEPMQTEADNRPGNESTTPPEQQLIVPFVGPGGQVSSILISEFDQVRNETRQKFIHRNAYERLRDLVPGEQKFERTAAFAFGLYDNGGNPGSTTVGFGCCPPCWVNDETGECQRLSGSQLIPCNVDCPGSGDRPPSDGNGSTGPTVIINDGAVPSWYIDSYLNHIDWINRPQGTGGTPTSILDLDVLLGDLHHNAGGGGVHQNDEENINCLTDAFPTEPDGTIPNGGGGDNIYNNGIGILALLTDLQGQSDEVFNRIVSVNSFFELNRDQGRYLIFHADEAEQIHDALQEGTISADIVSAYLDFKVTIDPCNSILPGLDFNLLHSNPEMFSILVEHLLVDPTDSERISIINLITSNPEIMEIHPDEEDPNACEVRLILSGFSYASCAWSIRDNANIAQSMTEERFGRSSRNDCSDAFRHAFFNALNAMSCGISMAREFGEAHECNASGPLILEKEMDLWNNEIGYDIFSALEVISNPDALADIVLSRLAAGEGRYLIPLDPDNKIILGVTGVVPTNPDCLP